MTILTAVMVGVIFAAATYLMLGRELKGVCMGVFLLGHGANLAIIATSRSPIDLKPPVVFLGVREGELGPGFCPGVEAGNLVRLCYALPPLRGPNDKRPPWKPRRASFSYRQ